MSESRPWRCTCGHTFATDNHKTIVVEIPAHGRTCKGTTSKRGKEKANG